MKIKRESGEKKEGMRERFVYLFFYSMGKQIEIPQNSSTYNELKSQAVRGRGR